VSALERWPREPRDKRLFLYGILFPNDDDDDEEEEEDIYRRLRQLSIERKELLHRSESLILRAGNDGSEAEGEVKPQQQCKKKSAKKKHPSKPKNLVEQRREIESEKEKW
jgi:hypothetical protein